VKVEFQGSHQFQQESKVNITMKANQIRRKREEIFNRMHDGWSLMSAFGPNQNPIWWVQRQGDSVSVDREVFSDMLKRRMIVALKHQQGDPEMLTRWRPA